MMVQGLHSDDTMPISAEINMLIYIIHMNYYRACRWRGGGEGEGGWRVGPCVDGSQLEESE